MFSEMMFGLLPRCTKRAHTTEHELIPEKKKNPLVATVLKMHI